MQLVDHWIAEGAFRGQGLVCFYGYAMTITTSTRAALRQPVVLWVAALCLPGLAIWVALAINVVCVIVGVDTGRSNGAMNFAGMLVFAAGASVLSAWVIMS